MISLDLQTLQDACNTIKDQIQADKLGTIVNHLIQRFDTLQSTFCQNYTMSQSEFNQRVRYALKSIQNMADLDQETVITRIYTLVDQLGHSDFKLGEFEDTELSEEEKQRFGGAMEITSMGMALGNSIPL